MLCRHRESMVELTADVTQGSPLSGYLALAEGEPPQPSPRLLLLGGRAAGKEMGPGGGRSRGAIPPTSTSKGTAPCAGRKLALLPSPNKSLNPTRYMSKKKIV